MVSFLEPAEIFPRIGLDFKVFGVSKAPSKSGFSITYDGDVAFLILALGLIYINESRLVVFASFSETAVGFLNDLRAESDEARLVVK